MAGSLDPVTRPQDKALAVLARDAAVGRVVRTRRWLIAAAAAGTAGLAALTSALLPGRSLGAKTTRSDPPRTQSASVTRSTTPPLPAPAGGSQLGLQPPGAAPSSSSGSAPQQSQPAPQPAPQPAQPAPSGGGTVVSGGS